MDTKRDRVTLFLAWLALIVSIGAGVMAFSKGLLWLEIISVILTIISVGIMNIPIEEE